MNDDIDKRNILCKSATFHLAAALGLSGCRHHNAISCLSAICTSSLITGIWWEMAGGTQWSRVWWWRLNQTRRWASRWQTRYSIHCLVDRVPPRRIFYTVPYKLCNAWICSHNMEQFGIYWPVWHQRYCIRSWTWNVTDTFDLSLELKTDPPDKGASRHFWTLELPFSS